MSFEIFTILGLMALFILVLIREWYNKGDILKKFYSLLEIMTKNKDVLIQIIDIVRTYDGLEMSKEQKQTEVVLLLQRFNLSTDDDYVKHVVDMVVKYIRLESTLSKKYFE